MCSLTCLLFLKGIPVLPVLFILSLFVLITWFALKTKKEEVIEETEENLYEKIRIHPIEINLNKELYTALLPMKKSILQSIQHIREKLAFDLGFVLPEVKIKTDRKLGYPYYQISFQGNSDGI